MKRPIRLIVPLVSAALLSACSSPAPEPTLYLMRGEVSEGSTHLGGPVRIGIGRVIVAPYLLASQGIVVETGPGEIRAARQHQWAEPLDSGLRWFLRGELGRELGHKVGGGLVTREDWDYVIDVYVARLHGTMSGTAILDAVYLIRSTADRRNLNEYRFSKSVPLSDDGYGALVSAEQGLVQELAVGIAAAFRERMDAGVDPLPAAPGTH